MFYRFISYKDTKKLSYLMTLIKSISGIRGTIGGKVGDNLTPVDAVKFASAYGTWLKEYSGKEKITVVVGRDARISGPMIHNLVVNTLIGLGIDVIDLGSFYYANCRSGCSA
jgi:phosphomannomutase